MQYQQLNSPEEFYRQAEGYLLRQEATNNLLLGLTINLIRQPHAYGGEPPYFGIVWDDTDVDAPRIVGTALRTPPRALILSHIEHRDAVRLIAQKAYEQFQTLPAVTGGREDSRQFAERWALISGQRARPGMFERIYCLERLIPVTNVPGQVRQAGEADRQLLRQWMRGFHADAFYNQAPPSDQEVEGWINNRISAEVGGMYFWEDKNGSPVSMAGYTGFTPNGVRIGPVYTPVEYRGKGYGSAVTAAVTRKQLDAGRRFCYLFTDLSNPTSNKIYQNIGYEPICDIDEYLFE